MDNNAHKEEWINEVMESANGISKAQPRAALYDRVMAKIGEPIATNIKAIAVARWVAAAILLLALNVGSVVYSNSKKEQGRNNNSNPFAAAMQAEQTYSY